jgi:peptidyl-prolyl cis-trans isomerase D
LKTHPVIRWLAYAAFALIIVTFIFAYGWDPTQGPAGQFNADPVIATYVEDGREQEIRAGETRAAQNLVYGRKLSLLDQSVAQFAVQQHPNDVRWLVTEQEAAEEALDQRMLIREAERMGLTVTRDEVMQIIRLQFGSDPNFQSFLRQTRRTEQQFVEELRSSELAERAKALLATNARATLFELWREYLLVKEKITLNLSPYPVERFKSEIAPTVEELEAFLEERHEDHRIEDQRRYAYIKLSFDEEREAIEAPEAEIAAHYEKTRSNYIRTGALRFEDLRALVTADRPTTATRILIERVHDELGPDVSWGDLANRINNETTATLLTHTADSGLLERTDPGLLVYGQEFIDRLNALDEDRISTPVLSPFGWHVVRVLERRPAGVQPLERVRDEVEEAYRSEAAKTRFQDKMKLWEAEVRNHATVNEMATAVGAEDKLTTRVASAAGSIPEIGSLGQHAPYVKDLRLRQKSQIIRLSQSEALDPPPIDLLAVIEIVEEIPSHLPELDEVRERVEEDFKERRARDLAKSGADAAYRRIRRGETFETVALDGPTTTVLTQPFTRDPQDRIVIDPESNQTFPIVNFMQESTRIAEGSTGLSAYGNSAESPEGYVIWKVERLEPPTREEFHEERRAFEADYLAAKRLIAIEEWLADRRAAVNFKLLSRPRLVVEGGPIDFGEIDPDGEPSGPSAITVRNAGDADLQIAAKAIEIIGPDREAFKLLNLPEEDRKLAVGESLRIEIAFDPDSAGAKRAQLDVRTDAGRRTIDLIGRASY